MENQRVKLLNTWLDVAQYMQDAGAEIWRVEDTLEKMAASYGAVKINAFSLISNISITCEFTDGEIISQTRRISNRVSTDLHRVEAINALTRDYCRSDMSCEELKQRLDKIMERQPGIMPILGTILAPVAFCIFFGGSIIDTVIAAAASSLLILESKTIGKYLPNAFIYNFIGALATGLAVYLCGRFIPGTHPDKSIIGVIMVLIPGISITHSIRDIIIGDTISGSMRFVESLIETIGIAAGYIAAMFIMGGIR